MTLSRALLLAVTTVLTLTAVCPPGQALLSTGTCSQVLYIQGCFTYKSRDACDTCEYNYNLVGGICDYSPSVKADCCVRFGQDGACAECNKGLKLVGGACRQVYEPGCTDWAAGACQNCASDFYIKGDKCVKGVEGCLSYSPDVDGLCLTCKPGLKSYKWRCLYEPIKGCSDQSANQCKSCYPPFKLQNNQCKIGNCLTANEYNCITCKDGFFLKQDGTCFPRDFRVESYTRGLPTSCVKPYKFINGACKAQGCITNTAGSCLGCLQRFKSVNQECVIEGCLHVRDDLCVVCDTGYHLKNGSCLKTTNSVDSVETVCKECSVGYYLATDNKCKVNEVGCAGYQNGVCTTCSNPFTLVDGQCSIDGCTDYQSTGCKTCAKPYALSQGICRLPFCNKSKSGICLECLSGYIRRNGACHFKDPQCIYNDAGFCFSCIAGYHVFGNECTKDIQGCLGYDSTTDACTSCQEGMFVTSTGGCDVKLVGCKYTNGQCAECSAPFTLNNGVCQIEGCSANGLTQTGCSSCVQPYKSSNNICIIPNCVRTTNLKCSACEEGYTPLPDGTCRRFIFYCVTYDDPNRRCITCADDYYVTSQGNCAESKPGCVYTNGICNSCSAPFVFDAGNCKITGCSIYSKTGCLTCKDIFVSIGNVCGIPQCIKGDNVTERCTACAQGYVVKQETGTCIRQIENCKEYDGDFCKACQDRFYLTSERDQCLQAKPGCVYQSGQCNSCQAPFVLRNGACIIEGCQTYDYNGCTACLNSNFILQNSICRLPRCAVLRNNKCATCQKDYILRNQQCVSYDKYCATYDSQNFCSSCLKGYYLDLTGYCQKQLPGSNYINAVIVSCRVPFTFVPENKSCVVDGCVEYEDAGCKKCVDGYQLEFFNCKLPMCVRSWQGQCLTCEQGYISYKGVCRKMDVNCVGYNEKGECQGCKDATYLLNDNACMKKRPGCVYTGAVCTSCYAPFSWVNNDCVIEGCMKANFVGCESCKYPYNLSQSQSCAIANCQRTNNGLCQQCISGYHAKKGLCEVNDPNCLEYLSNGNCNSCLKSFSVLDDGNCHFIDGNCKKLNLRACLECDDGYYVNKWATCSRRLVSCKAYNGGKCVECADKYYMKNGICYPFPTGCLKVVDGACTQCDRQSKTTYSLKNGRCIPDVNRLTYNDISLASDFANSVVGGQQVLTTDVNLELLPVSSIAQLVYSTVFPGYINFNLNYRGTNIGWKALNAVANQTVGFSLKQAQTFYKVDIQGGEGGAYLREFWIEYSMDGINWKRIDKVFDASASATGTYSASFTAIYAIAIRIVVKTFAVWPNFRFQFYVSNTATLSLLQVVPADTQIASFIQGMVSTKAQYQTDANIRGFYSPNSLCNATMMSMCWTGMDFCEPKHLTKLIMETPSESDQEDLKGTVSDGAISEYYLDYSLDGGQQFACYDQCRKIQADKRIYVFPKPLFAKSVRVHPTKWTGSPVIRFRFQWSSQ